MKGLLLIAHGSRLSSSNAEIAGLTEQLKRENSQLADGQFDQITHSFLELTEPSVHAGLAELIRLGCQDIHLFPYFLAAGYHVTSDLPALVKEAKSKYPEATFTLKPHLGTLGAIPKLILGNA